MDTYRYFHTPEFPDNSAELPVVNPAGICIVMRRINNAYATYADLDIFQIIYFKTSDSLVADDLLVGVFYFIVTRKTMCLEEKIYVLLQGAQEELRRFHCL
ncbi:hypothetical protein EVAR_54092_1 [Eumeta japonica]|uniref:Uncharacterized protein n=1 Tax=Eumeta variegata TaxID=151549 RepID=A0A4C1Z200_EUMVA|nr:hypothetical protein EVAR_54092_1 [Eumeta japonica]